MHLQHGQRRPVHRGAPLDASLRRTELQYGRTPVSHTRVRQNCNTLQYTKTNFTPGESAWILESAWPSLCRAPVVIMHHRIQITFGTLACSLLVIFTNATTSKVSPSPVAAKGGKNATVYPAQYQVCIELSGGAHLDALHNAPAPPTIRPRC